MKISQGRIKECRNIWHTQQAGHEFSYSLHKKQKELLTVWTVCLKYSEDKQIILKELTHFCWIVKLAHSTWNIRLTSWLSTLYKYHLPLRGNIVVGDNQSKMCVRQKPRSLIAWRRTESCCAPHTEPGTSSSWAVQRWSEGHQSQWILPLHEENNGHSEMSHPVLTLPKQCENAEGNQYTGWWEWVRGGRWSCGCLYVCVCFTAQWLIQTVSKGTLTKNRQVAQVDLHLEAKL